MRDDCAARSTVARAALSQSTQEQLNDSVDYDSDMDDDEEDTADDEEDIAFVKTSQLRESQLEVDDEVDEVATEAIETMMMPEASSKL